MDNIIDGKIRNVKRTYTSQILIVGSGAGGATAANFLARSGLDVVLLEEGGYYKTTEYKPGISKALNKMWRNSGVTPLLGRPIIPFAEACCVGGGTTVNGALMWRTPEETLKKWKKTYDLNYIEPESLFPYTKTYEKNLSISTQKDELHENSASKKLVQGADALGWHVEAVKRAQIDCTNANQCPAGCPTGAKQGMLETYIPGALDHGARLIYNCRVQKLIFAGRRVSGVIARMASGHLAEIYADDVFICGGPVQTPFLLIKSGIRKNVGYNFCIQPNLKIAVLFEDEINAHNGTMMTSQVKEFVDQGFSIGSSNSSPPLFAMSIASAWREAKIFLENWKKVAMYISLIKAKGRGRVRKIPGINDPIVSYRLHKQDIHTVYEAMKRMGQVLFCAGAKKIITPFKKCPVVSSQSELETILEGALNAKSFELISVHGMSSCHMSGDPQKYHTVTDNWGKVDGTDNLYIADASLLPGPPGVNPQQTICTMVMRNLAEFCDKKKISLVL